MLDHYYPLHIDTCYAYKFTLKITDNALSSEHQTYHRIMCYIIKYVYLLNGI